MSRKVGSSLLKNSSELGGLSANCISERTERALVVPVKYIVFFLRRCHHAGTSSHRSSRRPRLSRFERKDRSGSRNSSKNTAMLPASDVPRALLKVNGNCRLIPLAALSSSKTACTSSDELP